MRKLVAVAFAAALLAAGCGGDDDQQATRGGAAPNEDGVADLSGAGYETVSPEELERGRRDASWRAVVQIDSVGMTDTLRSPEKWEEISMETVNRGATFLPLHGDVAGPSVLTVQILLDRALFSPGVMDGRWGKNTEIAVYWVQRQHGLPATGRADSATFNRLAELAGKPRELVRLHTLTAEDVEGPFVEIPEDIYAKAKLECMCYESLSEKLGETFHATPELLEQLNPGVNLDSLQAGAQVRVPAVRDPNAARNAQVARIVVSAQGHYVHALDAAGKLLFHFPTTLGSTFDPSPTGNYKVNRVTPDPWWHYQPDILAHVDDSEEDARIPPGPNNAVGVVWMALSAPHYGIHGTSAPETIGYATSAGCVRLTNWDARFLSERVRAGVPVEFRDRGAPGARPASAPSA